jgi:5'-nucleotidase
MGSRPLSVAGVAHTKARGSWYPGGMRILVTNDDGIDSIGLHALARAMTGFGHVVIAAPDREFSGAGAAVGALHEFDPVVTRREVDGVPEVWTLNGPPALCVLYSRLGLFGERFDLVVSGINPGANVGRSVYHSGTIGACLTARNGGVSGVAVSQAVTGWGVEGQGWGDVIKFQKWHVAAEVARVFVAELITDLPAEPVVVNLNVPNLELDEIAGWEYTQVGVEPPRSLTVAQLVPTADPDRFDVAVAYGEAADLPAHTDGGAIERDLVTVTYLSRLTAQPRTELGKSEAALDALVGRATSS